jgi:hypothetical protein
MGGVLWDRDRVKLIRRALFASHRGRIGWNEAAERKDTIMYACISYSKMVTVDTYNEGCDPDTTTFVNSGQLNINSARTLPDLLTAIGDHFGLSIDDVCLYDDDIDDTEESLRIGYNRMENADGYAPDAGQLAAWKAGEGKLYLADYDFEITHRTERAVTRAEFEASGITTH